MNTQDLATLLGTAGRIEGPAGGEDPCPAVERLAALAAGPIAAGERERLLAHVETCPACAAEVELARSFFVAEADVAADPDLAYVVAALERGAALPVAAGEPAASARAIAAVPSPPVVRAVPRRAWAIPRTLLAAAGLVLVVGLVGVIVRESGPPALPPPPTDGPVRSGAIEALAPAGELAVEPTAFSWELPSAVGAATLRVVVLAVDDRELATVELPATAREWRPETALPLARGVLYRWRVEARAADGTVVARSELRSFRVAIEARAP